MLGSNLKLKKSANIATTPTGTAGGAMTSTQITAAAPGEWMPRLTAKESGTPGNSSDQKKQTQEAYAHNDHETDSADLVGYYVENLLVIPDAPGVYKAQSTSEDDATDIKKRAWGILAVGGALSSDDVVLNGLTLVAGVKTFSKILFTEVLDVISGAPAACAGRIDEFVGEQQIGSTPAGTCYASSEREYAFAASEGDTGTFTNRESEPGGLSWGRPNTPDTRIYVRNDEENSVLGPDERCALYSREVLEPGRPPREIPFRGRLYGEAIP